MSRRAPLGIVLGLVALAPARADVAPPPAELVEGWGLSPKYVKHVDVGGLPVLGSAAVDDHALAEAAYLIRRVIGHRPEVLAALARDRVRFVVMATTELTTDVPEHADLAPKDYWDRRARGLGATRERPAVSCGEENLLGLEGDPYTAENILIHEFAHAIHLVGLARVDRTFDRRLRAAYERARAAGLWSGTYAMENHKEYWAEATQSWFDCNRQDDAEHGPVDTYDELLAYDPEVAALLAEVYGPVPWRYRKPADRAPEERAHLAGFDLASAPRFAWPGEADRHDAQGVLVPLLPVEQAPARSPLGGRPVHLLVVNRRPGPVDLVAIGALGERQRRATVRPGSSHLQRTYAGSAWLIVEDGRSLGVVIATEELGRVEVGD